MNTREVMLRFEAERQALARWTTQPSPKCSTPALRPKVRVLRHGVAGVPIAAYCDKHRLRIRERLELFMHGGLCRGKTG
jgi:eukaryotic-like serine/threonine-protein kinase